MGDVIRPCRAGDFQTICAIINDGASAYEGVLPADRLTPYMSAEELQREIDAGVAFWGYEEAGALNAVMGVQAVQDVTLIRHAYVRSGSQKHGLGSRLLAHLQGITKTPTLVGTWAAAAWAIRFYERNGFQLVNPKEKDRLLIKYWTVPERQRETSVVLVDARWRAVQQEV